MSDPKNSRYFSLSSIIEPKPRFRDDKSVSPLSAAAMNSQHSQVLSIQYLRGIAAAMVIFHHALDQFSGFRRVLPLDTGASGVDIFFVISGFVMTYTVHSGVYSRREFISRRIVRIVPIYWIVTLIASAMLALALGPARHSVFSMIHTVASMLFWPMHNPGEPQLISPVVKLGWTLNFEMFFYFVFACFLPFDRRKRTAMIATFFAVLYTCASVTPRAPAPLEFWGNAIVFEFVIGCVVADLFLSGIMSRIPRSLMGAAGLIGITCLLLAGFGGVLGFSAVGPLRLLVFGLPASILVGSVIGLWRGSECRGRMRLLGLLGDASYSIYLVHLFAVIAMRIIWSRLSFPEEGLGWAALFIALCLVCGAGLGYLTHIVVERPATEWAKQFLRRKRSHRAANSS